MIPKDWRYKGGFGIEEDAGHGTKGVTFDMLALLPSGAVNVIDGRLNERDNV